MSLSTSAEITASNVLFSLALHWSLLLHQCTSLCHAHSLVVIPHIQWESCATDDN